VLMKISSEHQCSESGIEKILIRSLMFVDFESTAIFSLIYLEINVISSHSTTLTSLFTRDGSRTVLNQEGDNNSSGQIGLILLGNDCA